jgi:hypothetical protein
MRILQNEGPSLYSDLASIPLQDYCVPMERRDFISAITGLVLAGMVSRMDGNDKNTRGPIIVGAGRRVDAPDANVRRFPPQNVPKVRNKIQQLLASRRPLAIVSAAACGADLLLLDVAGEIHIRRYVLLPSEPEEFRVSSVTDRPGNWGALYTQVLRSAKVEVLKLPEGQEGYLETNLKLLDRGEMLAKDEHTTVNALVVWNQESRGPDDVTAHFLEQAKLRKMPILEIPTL